jgi:hypothetical protein
VNKFFADWYREVSIDPKADELTKRWQGIESFSQDSDAADLVELARLFHGLPLRDVKFDDKFRGALKGADDAFAMQGNLPELRVLAGATLVRHFEYEGLWMAAAALCIVCPSAHGLRQPPAVGILNHARQALLQRSSMLRRKKAASIPNLDVSAPLQEVKTALQNNQLPNLAGPLNTLLQGLATAVGQLNTWAQRASEEQELRQEESDVLWWLIGGHSRDLSVPFSSLKSPSGCLVAGKELADLARSLPGPYAAEAFLDSVLGQAHPQLKSAVSLADAISACPAEWRRALVMAEGLEDVLDLCPAHFAVQKFIESDGKRGWQTPFQNAWGFKATDKLSPLDLAVQTYQERLLARALRGVEESDNG